MFSLKRIIYIPFCLFLFSASSFSAPMSLGATGKEINDYAFSIKDFVNIKSGGIFNPYKGKSCIVRLRISRNGSFSFNIEGGHPDLCDHLSTVLNSMKNLPPPPSEQIYQIIKDARFDFKF